MQQEWKPGRPGTASGIVTKIVTHSSGKVLVTIDVTDFDANEHDTAATAVEAFSKRVKELESLLSTITAQRPITVYEAYSAQATAAEVARLCKRQRKWEADNG